MSASGMGCFGGAGSKPFYAALMAMPSSEPDARRFIEAEADGWLASDAEQIMGVVPKCQTKVTGCYPKLHCIAL